MNSDFGVLVLGEEGAESELELLQEILEDSSSISVFTSETFDEDKVRIDCVIFPESGDEVEEPVDDVPVLHLFGSTLFSESGRSVGIEKASYDDIEEFIRDTVDEYRVQRISEVARNLYSDLVSVVDVGSVEQRVCDRLVSVYPLVWFGRSEDGFSPVVTESSPSIPDKLTDSDAVDEAIELSPSEAKVVVEEFASGTFLPGTESEDVRASDGGVDTEYVAFLPVYADSHEYGAVVVHSNHEFSDSEVGVLDDVSENVSHAVGRLRTRDASGRHDLDTYRRIVETARDGIYTADTEGYITAVNESLASSFGYERDELIGKHMSEIIDEDAQKRAEGVIRNLIKNDDIESELFEVEIPTKEGDVIPCEVRVSLIESDESDDIIGGSVGVVRDITERKERERKLENYRSIVETARDGLYVVDEDGVFIEVNQSFVSMTGYERDEIVGSDASLILDEEAIKKGEEIIRELLSNSELESDSYEMEIETAGGEEILTENHISILPYEDEFRGSVGVVRDITERKKMEEELRASEQRLSLLVEQSPLAVIEWNPDFEVTEWNPAAERIFGYSEEEALGRHASFIIPETSREEVNEVMDALFDNENEGEEHFVNPNLTKEGREIMCEWHNTSLVDEDGNVVGVASLVRDVTERANRVETLDALHEATRDLMQAETKREVCEITVDAAQDILGLSASLVHLYEDEILKPVAYTDELSDMVDKIQTYRKGEGVTGTVFEGGDVRVDQDIAKNRDEYIRDPDEVPMRSVMMVPLGRHGVLTVGSKHPNDLDEYRVDFAKILASNTESALDRAERESLMREREEELERQNQRLENFAGLVTHDLRNPLQIAEGFLDMARMTDDEEYFDRIEDALTRMERIIEDVLTLARQGESVGETESVNLRGLVRDAWDNVDTYEAELEIVDSLETIQADRSRLMEAVENLFRNSIEHVGEDVTVRVGNVETEDTYRFYIEDDGPGILPAERDAVFESGYTTEDEGTGFGLAIVKEIVEAHGWEISVAEGSDGGARFEITVVE